MGDVTNTTSPQPFADYERLLWKILAKLAQQGFIAAPTDAADLINEFYASAWSGLLQRYDPARGAFRSYLVAAFYRFARDRIIRLHAWRSRLVDVELLAAAVIDRSRRPDEVAELGEAGRVVDALPELERSVLRGRLSGRSERELRAELGVSRYRIREALIDALGQVALVLGGLPAEGPRDAAVAVALWSEGRSVRDTAELIGISLPEVRTIRQRLVERIARSLNRAD